MWQEDIENISQVVGQWEVDLTRFDSDTDFLLKETARIGKILERMRSLTRVNSNRTRVHAHQVLHDALNINADLFAKHKIQVAELFEAKSDLIWVDRDEVIQSVTNLLRNSLQAVTTSQKAVSAPKVIIETRNQGAKLIIDVVDNGPGIDESVRTKLFESQISTKTPDMGTGLGLSISRRFVRAVEGDLYLVSSVPFKETRFRIEIPVKEKFAEGVAA
jgi:signal transduction histidine kinase